MQVSLKRKIHHLLLFLGFFYKYYFGDAIKFTYLLMTWWTYCIMYTEQTNENIYVLFGDLTVHGRFHLLLQMMMVLFQTLIQMLH